jgi:hypothetical protein
VWVRPADYEKWAEKRQLVLWVDSTKHHNFYDALKREVGKPYDHLAILGFVVGRNWRETDSWICSELQAYALEIAGIVPRLLFTPNKITPNSLALVFNAVGAH